MLRNNANLYLTSDSMLRIFEEEAMKLPKSDDQKQTILFIRLIGLSYRIKSVPIEKRREIIQSLIKDYDDGNNDNIYTRIEKLYSLCLCLTYIPEGELYPKYLNELEGLIQELPQRNSTPLKNLFYSRQAILSTLKNDKIRAIAADKKLLEIIDDLQAKYIKTGRVFKNYDSNEYICRVRMLNNFENLSPEEVEDNYSRILDIAQRNSDVRRDFETTERPTIFYLMARKEYAKVLPILKRHKEAMIDERYRPFYLKYTIKAARKTGDKETLLASLEAYNEYLEELMAAQSDSKVQELQILYDVESLRRESAALQHENHEIEQSINRNIIIGSAIAGILLAIFLVFTYMMYRKQKNLSKALLKSQVKLKAEKQSLLAAQQEIMTACDEAENANRLKTQFIQNMRHEILTPLNAIVGFSQLIADSVPEEKRKDMERYTKIIAENNDILHTVITDIIDISQLETGEMKVSYHTESLNEICINVISTIAHKVAPGVKMYFDAPEDDVLMYTDRIRVEQVLTNYLINAVKFTEQGSIVLSYRINTDKSEVVFSVTDTGIGIPSDKHEVIFERFVKLNQFSTGTGLGLHICRLIADLLKGDVKVDSTYTKGARLLFILPLQSAQGNMSRNN